MGSVGENYRCPLCGRTGRAFYTEMDIIDFPICTGKVNEDDSWNCLWDDVLGSEWIDTTHRHVLALRKVLRCHSSSRDESWLQRLAKHDSVIRRIIQYGFVTSHWHEAS